MQNIPECDENEKRDEESEAHRMEDLFHFLTDRSTFDFLNRDEKNAAAVERRNRQDVYDAKIHRKERCELQDINQPKTGHFFSKNGNPDRPGYIRSGAAPEEKIVQNAN